MSQQVSNSVAPRHISNWVVVVLLAAILSTQLLILMRMPVPLPTIGAVQNAKTDNARLELLRNIPVIRVQGGTIDDITGTVDVTVQNTPLEVEVDR